MFEAFFAKLKVALFSAIMLSFPVVANQIWRFVAPGLYKKEKRALLPFLVLTPVLFLSGAAMAYYMAMPLALHFLLGFQGNVGGIQQEALPAIGNYLSFVTKFLFGFGVAFLLPVLLMLLERAGIVTREPAGQGPALRRCRDLRRRRAAGAARRRVDAAARGAASAALRIRADRDLVHRAPPRARGR